MREAGRSRQCTVAPSNIKTCDFITAFFPLVYNEKNTTACLTVTRNNCYHFLSEGCVFQPACLPEGGTAQAVVTTALAASPCKSYTPLSALSSMQPPGHHHGHPPVPACQGPRGPPLSPLQRRHGCTSAFTAPPNYAPPPPGQPHPQGPPPHPDVHGKCSSTLFGNKIIYTVEFRD